MFYGYEESQAAHGTMKNIINKGKYHFTFCPRVFLYFFFHSLWVWASTKKWVEKRQRNDEKKNAYSINCTYSKQQIERENVIWTILNDSFSLDLFYWIYITSIKCGVHNVTLLNNNSETNRSVKSQEFPIYRTIDFDEPFRSPILFQVFY